MKHVTTPCRIFWSLIYTSPYGNTICLESDRSKAFINAMRQKYSVSYHPELLTVVREIVKL